MICTADGSGSRPRPGASCASLSPCRQPPPTPPTTPYPQALPPPPVRPHTSPSHCDLNPPPRIRSRRASQTIDHALGARVRASTTENTQQQKASHARVPCGRRPAGAGPARADGGHGAFGAHRRRIGRGQFAVLLSRSRLLLTPSPLPPHPNKTSGSAPGVGRVPRRRGRGRARRGRQAGRRAPQLPARLGVQGERASSLSGAR